jgi:hypothetical protein
MKQTIYEEIQRMTLLSKYDNSKTLSEQGSADINMDRLNKQQLSQATPTDEFVKKFYNDGASGAGTNEKEMRDGIATIKSAAQFWEKDKLVKTASGMDIAGVINDEFGSNNTWSLQVIVNHLKTIGINSTFNKDSEGNYVEGSFKISTTPAVAATDPWTKFPCVTGNKNAVKGTLPDGSIAYTMNKVTYYNNGRKRLADGTMGNYTCNDPEFKKQVQGKTKVAKPVEIPAELKDSEGIKKFQDWLDVNAAGWATGYKEGIINKGQNGGGYGNFGPRTQKGWATYKDTYLKSASSANPYADYKTAETNDKVEGDDTGTPQQ